MKLKILAIFDTAAQAYMQPGYAHALGHAIRDFADAVNKEGTPLNAHPHDFTLCVIGEFDDRTGAITPKEPQVIAEGIQHYTGPERRRTVYQHEPIEQELQTAGRN